MNNDLKYKIGDKVCYKGNPYKIIGRELDHNFFVMIGLDRSIETVHYTFLQRINK